jgi:hypothetical protein
MGFWSGVGDLISHIPIIGSIYDIGKGIYDVGKGAYNWLKGKIGGKSDTVDSPSLGEKIGNIGWSKPMIGEKPVFNTQPYTQDTAVDGQSLNDNNDM